jgi:hypothetical protein
MIYEYAFTGQELLSTKTIMRVMGLDRGYEYGAPACIFMAVFNFVQVSFAYFMFFVKREEEKEARYNILVNGVKTNSPKKSTSNKKNSKRKNKKYESDSDSSDSESDEEAVDMLEKGKNIKTKKSKKHNKNKVDKKNRKSSLKKSSSYNKNNNDMNNNNVQDHNINTIYENSYYGFPSGQQTNMTYNSNQQPNVRTEGNITYITI